MKTTVTSAGSAKSHATRQTRLLDRWLDVVKIVAVDRIKSDDDYDRVTEFMQEVMAEIGRKKKHPLCGLMDILEMRLREYDDAHHPMGDVSGVEMLKFLMEQHGMKQKDLPEIGSQGVVSEILRGKRELNLHHISALAKRFHVPASVFLPGPEARK